MKRKKLNINKLVYTSTLSILLISINSTLRHPLITANKSTLRELINNDNTLNQLVINGDAFVDNNIITLTPDKQSMSGTAYLKTPINFSNDVLLSLKVNVGDKSQQRNGGDGIAVSFVPYDQINLLNQKHGGALGLGGIKNVFGFKVDTYFNQVGETGIFDPDPSKFGFSQGSGVPFGAFFSGTSEGVIQTLSEGAQSLDQKIYGNQLEDLTISYDSNNRLFQINYHGKTWNHSIKNANELDKPMYLVFSSSTGTNHNLQQILLDTTDFKPYTSTVTVNYLDESNKKIAPSETLTGTPNEKYTTNEKKIEGYELIEKPNNNSGIFSGSSSEVNYYYKPITHQIIIDYMYNNYSLRKEILTGNTGETINHASTTTLSVLKDYTIDSSDWPGSFSIPNSDQKAWHFKIWLSKKAASVTKNNDSVKVDVEKINSTNIVTKDPIVTSYFSERYSSEIIKKYLFQKLFTNTSKKYVQIEHPSIVLDRIADNYSNLDKYFVSINNQKEKTTAISTTDLMNIDQVAFRDNFISRNIKPSPFSVKVSDFTKVLNVMASYTTFTDR
ncbi:lectin-like domain-containing protein [Leuconostoc mesenteroides]|uniref:lectin-like domain-containing protein n=1 Tax=Leuconostoc mesenteroides TaxID=1245 RepID=UPI0039BD3492